MVRASIAQPLWLSEQLSGGLQPSAFAGSLRYTLVVVVLFCKMKGQRGSTGSDWREMGRGLQMGGQELFPWLSPAGTTV